MGKGKRRNLLRHRLPVAGWLWWRRVRRTLSGGRRQVVAEGWEVHGGTRDTCSHSYCNSAQ